MHALPIVLKQNARRSVCVERDAHDDAELRVVKRFHARGRLDRSLDGRRARSEFELLSALARVGFPVPEPLAVRESKRGWELVTRWITPSVTLADLLRERAPWPAPPERVARDLGELVARAHALGLDHPDLHAGNVLVGADGKLWLVDLHGARVRTPLTRRARMRDLVEVAADVRELASARFRARFFVSYRLASNRSRAGAAARSGAGRASLAREIETSARLHRLRVIAKSSARWTRRSSVCTPIDACGAVGFRTLDLTGDELERCLVEARCSAADGDRASRAPLRIAGGEWVDCGAHAWNAAAACWYGAARLFEHGIRCARPLLFTYAPTVRAGFVVPVGSRSLDQEHDRTDARGSVALAPTAVGAERPDAAAIGALFGALFDRGLDLKDVTPSPVWRAPDGGVLFGPRAGLHLRIARPRGERRAWISAMAVARASGLERADDFARLADAFVRAQRSGPEARRRAEEAIRA